MRRGIFVGWFGCWVALLGMIVVPVRAEEQANTSDNAADPSQAPAETSTNETDLGETTVTAPAPGETGSYTVENSTTATHTDTPIFDLPLSLQVVPQQVFTDQSAEDIYEGLRNVSGVHPNKGAVFNNSEDGGLIRGFLSSEMYYNGFLIEASSAFNVPNFQRVEVLKGPSSMLYGLMEPGGIINVVTETPQPIFHASISQQFASYDTYRSTLDVTGPLNDKGAVAYRLNGGYYTEQSFRDYVEEERYWVAPSILWKPMDETTIIFDLSYGGRKKTLDQGVAFSANGQPVASPDTFLGEPGLPGQIKHDLFFNTRLEHKFSDNLTLRTGLMYHHWDVNNDGVRTRGTTSAANTVNRLYDTSDYTEDSIQWNGELVWKFDLGPTSHKLLTGMDVRFRNQFIDLTRANMSAINIINPVYGAPLPATPHLQDINFDRTWVGFYLQDQIDLTPDKKFKLLLGGRFDWVDTTNRTKTISTGNTVESDRIDTEFTGRAGLMYEPWNWLGIYGSVSQSFVPSNTTSQTVSGELLDAERGLQYEAGLKIKPLNDDRLVMTTAIYQLTKENVAIADINNPGFSVNAGELRSTGFEFDVAGDLGNGWSLIGNYTYTDTEVLNSDNLPIGARFANVPLHSGSIWAKYTMQNGVLKGLGAGAGIFFLTDRPGDNANSFNLDGYQRVDLGVFYEGKLPTGNTFHARLNVKNVFDSEFYESSVANARVWPGEPLTVVFTLGVDF